MQEGEAEKSSLFHWVLVTQRKAPYLVSHQQQASEGKFSPAGGRGGGGGGSPSLVF